jgi:hypothetical protein
MTPADLIYGIYCPASGDTAEAETLAAALVAAATLADDHGSHHATTDAYRAARASLIVTREGVYDGLATTMARDGQRA